MEEGFEYVPCVRPSRVCIIGAGLVGSTYAYTLLMHGTADEICLIDIDQARAEGEAMDLNHAMPFLRRTEIWAGTMDDVRDADIVVISAGAAQKPGETRMDLLKRNAEIVGDIAEHAGRLAPSAVYLVVTNPVDVMSYVVMTKSQCHHTHVIGSGTSLDTARLRFLLGREMGIDPRSIHAFVMGEHGDSELVAWSRSTVAGASLDGRKEFSQEKRERIFSQVRDAAYQIIAKKGATYYAIGAALNRITESILKDQRTVYSVSAYLEGEYGIFDTYLGVPAVIGRDGVLEILEMPLSQDELRNLHSSARLIRDSVFELRTNRAKKARVLTGTGRNPVPALSTEHSSELSPGISIVTKRPFRKPRPL